MKEYKFKINGSGYTVAINGIEGNIADVTVNGINHKVEIETGQAAAPEKPQAVRESNPSKAAPVSGGYAVTSPLPGVIIEICVKEGQAVRSGEKVAVLEAMKMENEILAEKDGTVTGILVSTGISVLEGDKIVTIG